MKTIFLSIFLITNLISIGSDAVHKSADSAYLARQYDEAIKLYSQLLAENQLSAPLYFNLGNAYFKNNEIGKAIWAYQKAKKIDPKQQDVTYNLNYVSALTKDKIKQSESGITKWMTQIFYSKSINFWSYTALFVALIASLLFYLFKVSVKKNKRSIYLLGFISMSVIVVACLTLAFSHYSHIKRFNNGIVVDAVVMVKTAPNEEEAVAFELHEGAKFLLKDSQGDWHRIQVGKDEGWIKKSVALLY